MQKCYGVGYLNVIYVYIMYNLCIIDACLQMPVCDASQKINRKTVWVSDTKEHFKIRTLPSFWCAVGCSINYNG